MEFASQTYLETTTQIAVSTNTISAENILNPDIRRQWISDANNNDSLTSSITLTFDEATAIDRIAIMECNWKKFNVYYNGATANAFTLTNPTTTSQFTTNANENVFLAATAVTCTSITFDIYSTHVANSEKAVGYIYVGKSELEFPRIPNAASYTPVRDPKDVTHELSDGGTRRHLIQTKWSAKVKLSYVTESFRDDLKEIFEAGLPYTFIPFGTGTGWDGIIFEANWVGNFDFYKYADNATQAGYNGSIDLKET